VSVEHDRFELQRTYPAPPERVFARWADPALKAGWFSAPGAEYEFDFRVGGHEVNRDRTLLTVTEQIALLDGRDTRAARKRGVTTLLERLGEALD
jgi:hypothetical protein